MKRVTPLDGVHNFRHWSGYDAADQRQVKPGLYRSGHFARSSDADKAFFDDLGLSVIVDFRRPRERNNEPSPWLENSTLNVISSDHDDHDEPPHLRFLREGDLSTEAVRNYMLSAYRRIPMEKGNQAVFIEGFKALASGDADNGLLAHCAAGKDRTGIFCALVLGELGVSDSDVFEDYLLTNEAVDFDALVPVFQKRLIDTMGLNVPETGMRAFLGVDSDYLAEAFKIMGDRDHYLETVLGITPDERQALRNKWLLG